MASRYSNLFALQHIPWYSGTPVLLMAGALLQDHYSGQLLCQLRLHSISEKAVKSVCVLIRMLDSADRPLEPVIRYQYLDLSLQRDDEAGAQTAIILPRRDARGFSATVAEVIFEDNSIWQADDDTEWQQLSPVQRLERAYGDAQTAEQFRISFGSDCRFLPAETDDLWFCTCGAVNDRAEEICHRCRRVRTALMNVNPEALRAEADSRQAQEQKWQAEDQLEAVRRRNRLIRIAVVVIPLLILAAGLLKVMPGYLQQRQDYRNAESLLAVGKYEEAASAFSSLGDYRDSAEQAAMNVPYQQALGILSAADADDASALSSIGHSRAELSDSVTAAMLLYQEALERFTALDDYRDSAECAERCREGIKAQEQLLLQRSYDTAVQQLELQQYSQARQAFLKLGDFEDSADLAMEAVYRKAIGLYDYIVRYDVRQVYADLSTSPERGSSFAIPKDAALAMGSQCVADLYAACGKDPVDVNLTDQPSQSMRPLADCVTDLFAQLKDYRDSSDRIAGIRDATDYTRDFFMLCETGDLHGALEWLASYEGEFADKELWQARLELYLPFCTSWSLYSGDATVIPLTVWRNGRCMDCSTRVLLTNNQATLRLSANDGEEYYLDLVSALDDTYFLNQEDPNFRYLLVINNVGRMSYLKYDTSGNLITSCEYKPI